MGAIVFLILLGGAVAQTPATPEIRGVVTEHYTNAPVAGAQVLISEFVVVDGTVTRKPVMSVFTGSRGDFQFRPDHLGRFWVEASKQGYDLVLPEKMLNGISETSAELTLQRPTTMTNLMLFLPGRLTGRVVDEDGKPVANLNLVANVPNIAAPIVPEAKTDADGAFTFDSLPGGPRIVKAGPRTRGAEEATDKFTEEDLKTIEEDFEVSYWPGGVTDQRQAIPIEVIPGATANLGTIRLRKVSYYSAHLTLTGECEPNSYLRWHFRDPGDTDPLVRIQTTECHKELLFRMLRPGSHLLAIFTNVVSNPVPRSWALVPINIKKENVEATSSPIPSEDIPVRWMLPDGKPVTALGSLRLMLRSGPTTNQFMDAAARPDEQGNMLLRGIVFSRQQVSFLSPASNLAVKEIRYNHLPVQVGTFDIVHNAPLQIVLDDQPASIAATVMDRDKPVAQAIVVLASLPLAESPTALMLDFPYFFGKVADAQGQVLLPGLASGEYRLVAVPQTAARLVQDAQALRRMIFQGQKITIERGEQKTMEVQLTDTPR